MSSEDSADNLPEPFCDPITRPRSTSLLHPLKWPDVPAPEPFDGLPRTGIYEKSYSESCLAAKAAAIQVNFLPYESIASAPALADAEEHSSSIQAVNPSQPSLHSLKSGHSSRHNNPETSTQPRSISNPRVLEPEIVVLPAEEITSVAPKVSFQIEPYPRGNIIAFALGCPTDTHWLGSGTTPQTASTETLTEHTESHESRLECCGVDFQTCIRFLCVTGIATLFLTALCCVILLCYYYLPFTAGPSEIPTIDEEHKSILIPEYFSNINITENPCENFYLYTCRSKENRWIKGDLRKPFQKHIETVIGKSIKTILTMDFYKHGLPMSASLRNVQGFYKACIALNESKPNSNKKLYGALEFWHLANLVTGSKIQNTVKVNWHLITLNAIKTGFYPFFFVNITTVVSELGELFFKVEPPLLLNQYANVWMNIKPLIDTVTPPGWKEGALDITVPKFVRVLQEMSFQFYQNRTDYFAGTETQKYIEKKLLDVIKEVAKISTLNSSQVLDLRRMVKFLQEFQRYLSRTDRRTWATYVNIIMFLNDCRYLPIDQRQLCSKYLVEDSVLKITNQDEYCLQATLKSPWFTGVAEANYIEYSKLDFDFDAKLKTTLEVLQNVNTAMAEWLQGDPWLSEIYKKGAKKHLEDLKISLAWRDQKFSLNSFEDLHKSHTMKLPNSTILHMAHVIRKQFMIDEFNTTKLVKRRSQPALSIPDLSGFVEYDKETHTIVLGYSALEVQRYSSLLASALYGSLGEWIATAMEKIFDYPELKYSPCIYPHSWWKYSLLLYSSEYIKCLKGQYEDYNKVFGISDGRWDMIDFENNLAALIGSDIAYRAYVNSSGQDYDKYHRLDVDVTFTGSQLYWLTSMLFRCGTETMTPSFFSMAPCYTSPSFRDDFKCTEDDKMISKKSCAFHIPEEII